MPNGPKRNVPASRSSRLPNTLGAVETRDAQPVDATVRSHEGARVAVGQEAVVRDRRER